MKFLLEKVKLRVTDFDRSVALGSAVFLSEERRKRKEERKNEKRKERGKREKEERKRKERDKKLQRNRKERVFPFFFYYPNHLY